MKCIYSRIYLGIGAQQLALLAKRLVLNEMTEAQNANGKNSKSEKLSAELIISKMIQPKMIQPNVSKLMFVCMCGRT